MRKASRATLADFLAGAQAKGLIVGAEPETMTSQFLTLLWGALLMSLLMRVVQAPGSAEIDRRARAAARTLLAFYPARL